MAELDPVPSAVEAVAASQPTPAEGRERLAAYVDLLGRAFAQDPMVMGPTSGQAYRLWQAGRFTSLRALLSWQIGQLPFAGQAILDLQAIAWPERLRWLDAVLTSVAIGGSLPEIVETVSRAVRRAIG